ncbi:hypothetical protein CCACVL1_04659 [Corchorus capsularis]|uniref:Uncharacterized protein n=1 Tax=Corchorus capsularis TaxID=210143 RepID=A0A1R3JQF1_COCAP|nr:hypothetical protein CCACVL1_04659 [Corchorus capsularis]
MECTKGRNKNLVICRFLRSTKYKMIGK